jgi:glycosyltransferase involved in cell wall biosynthesis
LKIVIFITSLGSGGAERVTANLSRQWTEQGWEVTIVTLAPQSEDFYELHPAVRRIALNLVGESAGILNGLLANLRRVWALRRILRQLQPDAVLGMMSTAGIIGVLAGVGLKCRVIVAERIHPPRRPLGKVWEKLRAVVYGRTNAVVALTIESARWLKQYTRAHKVVVIPNAVIWPIPTHFPTLDPGAFFSRTRRILLAAGRLDQQKGFDLLLDAFARLANEHPAWDLVILGEGPERAALEMQVQSLGLCGRVFLPGRVGNISEWYNRADIYALSSRFEGFPNTLLEAMACGCPVVSFDCNTGPRDIVRHRVDGLLVRPEDVVSLGAALSALMGDRLRKRLARRAVEVRERFSPERVTAMWGLLLETVPANRKVP